MARNISIVTLENDRALLQRVLLGICRVDMQSRNDAQKLKELAEWRLEAKRVLDVLNGRLAPAYGDYPESPTHAEAVSKS